VVDEADASARRYRSLFVHNPDAVFSVDRTPRFTSANPAAEQISGYSLAELLDLTPGRLLAPDDAARTMQHFQRALTGEPCVDTISIVHKDGHHVVLNLTLVPIQVGEQTTGVYGIAQDITARRRTEAERDTLLARATAAEQRAAFLAHAGELLTASLDYETTLRSIAQLVVPDLADWCAVDIATEGEVRRLVAAVNPIIRDQVEPARQQGSLTGEPAGMRRRMRVIQTGRPEFVPDLNAADVDVSPDLEPLLRSARALGVTSYIGVPLTARGRTLGSITFVYARSGKRYSDADFVLAQDLARRAGMAMDNARLYQDAQQAVQLREEFLASASHDLRTPVTSIKAYAQILQRRAAKTASREMEAMLPSLQAIDDAASRITAQINELMDLSRLQSGRPLELQRTPVDLVALVQRIAATHRQLSTQHPIVVTVLPSPGTVTEVDLTGEWDANRLERVVNNLLSNAIKYSPDGGVITITLRRDNGAEGGTAMLEICDQGIGIPAADLPRIFERFYRASNVADQAPGTGIDLAGSRDIVRQHGGTIRVESSADEGSCFTVCLPLAAV